MSNNCKKGWCIFLVIVVVICSPFVVLCLMMLGNPVVKLTDSSINNDWIGFYGSYLGSIFGGLATLIGVQYTIRENKKNKHKEEVKEYPFIVPLQKFIVAYIDTDNEKIYLANGGKDENWFENELIYLDLINLGKQHAFGVSYEWVLPKLKDIHNSLEYIKNDNELKKFIENFLECHKTTRSKGIQVFQIIKSSDNEEMKKASMFVELEMLTRQLILSVFREENNGKEDKLHKNIYLGMVSIESKNIYGDTISNKYSIKATICKGPTIEKVEGYYLTLDFNLENENS